MGVGNPDFLLRVQSRRGVDGYLHHPRYFYRPAFSLFRKVDRNSFHAEHRGDKRG